MSLGDIASALGGGIERIATAAIPVATAIYNERIMREQRRAMPTGASGVPLGSDLMTTGLPSALLPLLGGIGGGLALSQPGQLEEGGLLEGLESEIERETTLWRRSSGIGGRVSPVRTVLARHPQTGSIAAWEYKGQPVLYSGDLRTCRRVRKVARGAAAGVGLRFRRRAGR
ncbi:MAG TPA: hypothetical protein VFV07_00710 [Rhizomicrobium sp.]|nr:hypothetical protein [Rhizomicrobium sp.]